MWCDFAITNPPGSCVTPFFEDLHLTFVHGELSHPEFSEGVHIWAQFPIFSLLSFVCVDQDVSTWASSSAS